MARTSTSGTISNDVFFNFVEVKTVACRDRRSQADTVTVLWRWPSTYGGKARRRTMRAAIAHKIVSVNDDVPSAAASNEAGSGAKGRGPHRAVVKAAEAAGSLGHTAPPASKLLVRARCPALGVGWGLCERQRPIAAVQRKHHPQAVWGPAFGAIGCCRMPLHICE